MKKIFYTTLMLLLVGGILFSLTPAVSTANAPDRHLSFSNGRLSMKAGVLPLQELLAEIGEILGAEIHIYDDVEDARVSMDCQGLVPEDLLRRIMRGRSYAVVYGVAGRDGDHVRKLDVPIKNTRLEDDEDTSGEAYKAVSGDTETIGREQKILRRVASIERDIDSGYADQWYEHWVKIRGERYVSHPMEELKRLKAELDALKK